MVSKYKWEEKEIQKILKCELKAYSIMNDASELKNYVPKIYKPLNILEIKNAQACLSDEYYLDLNFTMDYIEGDHQDWSSFIEIPTEIILSMDNLKIDYSDSKVISNSDGYKFVDINMK